MDDVTEEVTELLDVMSIIGATWPRAYTHRATKSLAVQCSLFVQSLLLLMDNPLDRDAVDITWEGNPTYNGAATAAAKRAVELGAPVATVNFLIVTHLGG